MTITEGKKALIFPQKGMPVLH